MTIGTSLFARLSTEGFARVQGQIADLQTRVSAGTNDPNPSADPARAAKLNAADELRTRLDRFTDNAMAATDRLALTDSILADVSTMVRQLHEIAIRSVNDTMTDDGASGLRIEAERLRESLIVAANTRDAMGQPLFSGYSLDQPFVETNTGVEFVGDTGRSSLRVSESMVLTTSLNGADVFGSRDTGLFQAVDSLIASLDPLARAGGNKVQAEGSALLRIPVGRSETEVGFRLSGPFGAADIKVPLVSDVPGPMIDAINASFGQTGVSAALSVDGESILLTSTGTIGMEMATRSDSVRQPVAYLEPLEPPQKSLGVLALVPSALSAEGIVGSFDQEVTNIAVHRAEAGALARISDRQIETLATRKMQLDVSISNLRELDMAEAVTRLQTLLMTQEAAQQTFVRIRSSGLFDYIR